MRQVVRALGADPDVILVPPPGVDTDEARFAVYERLLRLLENAASGQDQVSQPGQQRQPLIIVIDDVQWADPTSIRCLAYLAGALMDIRLRSC